MEQVFISPLSWRDPSGLAPEKERKRDRILYTLLDMETWANVVNKIDAEYQAFMAYIDSELDGMESTEEERGRYWKKWGGDRRGESNENAANNGQKGAWNIRNEWNKDFIDTYREFAPKQAEIYKNKNKEFTCEDLALQVLIDFSSQYNLPLILENKDGDTFNASDPKWGGDIREFTCQLLGSFSASDLQLSGNTIGIGINDVKAGDLLIQANDHNGIGHHTQLVIEKNNFFMEIIQGNTKFPFRLFNSPCDNQYIGSKITPGIFSLPFGNYINYNTGRTYENGHLNNFQYKSWNFFNFNKGIKK